MHRKNVPWGLRQRARRFERPHEQRFHRLLNKRSRALHADLQVARTILVRARPLGGRGRLNTDNLEEMLRTRHRIVAKSWSIHFPSTDDGNSGVAPDMILGPCAAIVDFTMRFPPRKAPGPSTAL